MTKKSKNIKSIKEVIKDQIDYLFNNQYQFKNIIKIRKYDYSKDVIGNSLNNICLNNYNEQYDLYSGNGSLKQNNDKDRFFIKFSDSSIIRINYEFANDRIKSATADYLQPYEKIEANDIYGGYIQKDNPVSTYNYIRADLDYIGYKPKDYHALSHLHIGVEGDLRIPLHSLMLPFDFLYIILRYIYKINDPKLETHRDNCAPEQRVSCLSKIELDKLRLLFHK